MKTLEEDLLLMNTLHGEQLDAHLYKMKSRYIKPEEKAIIRKHLNKELVQIENRVDSIEQSLTIREQMKDVADLVPIAYIAKKYFGKSRSWLYQRISGYSVRGHVYTLNKKEIEIFNRALREIGNKIGSLSVG